MATQNPTLTEQSVKALTPRSTVYRVRDGIADPNLKGFGVVVAPSGTRSFFLSYTSPETGKRTQGTVGTYPSMKLAKARSIARQWREAIRQGVDPVLSVKQEREARLQAAKKEASLGSVEDLFDLYARDLEADGKRAAVFVRDMYRRDIAEAIGSKKAKDVTTDDCADIIATIAERGALTKANRVRSYLVAAFNFGMRARNLPRWRRTAADFGITSNPATGTERALKQEPRGQRFLSREELRTFWRALDDRELAPRLGESTKSAFRLLLATGQRVEEVLGATWDEFDTKERLWMIPAGRRKNAAKNLSGEPHIVPLTGFHVALLERLKPYSEGSRFLFPSKKGDRPRASTMLSIATGRLCARIGMVPFAPRDIRRTWKTLTGSIGIDLEIRNRLQGHAMDDIGSLHYDRYDYLTEKRAAMEKWAAFLENLINGSDTVVPFARQA